MFASGEVGQAFAVDRKAMRSNMTQLALGRRHLGLPGSYLRRLANISHQHDFLFGAEAGAAHFAELPSAVVFTPTRTPAVADILQPTPSLLEWIGARSSVGYGRLQLLGSADVIEAAGAPTPSRPATTCWWTAPSRTTTASRWAAG